MTVYARIVLLSVITGEVVQQKCINELDSCLVEIGISEEGIAEQLTKADRDACHALCRKANPNATLRRLSSTVNKN